MLVFLVKNSFSLSRLDFAFIHNRLHFNLHHSQIVTQRNFANCFIFLSAHCCLQFSVADNIHTIHCSLFVHCLTILSTLHISFITYLVSYQSILYVLVPQRLGSNIGCPVPNYTDPYTDTNYTVTSL